MHDLCKRSHLKLNLTLSAPPLASLGAAPAAPSPQSAAAPPQHGLPADRGGGGEEPKEVLPREVQHRGARG